MIGDEEEGVPDPAYCDPIDSPLIVDLIATGIKVCISLKCLCLDTHCKGQIYEVGEQLRKHNVGDLSKTRFRVICKFYRRTTEKTSFPLVSM